MPRTVVATLLYPVLAACAAMPAEPLQWAAEPHARVSHTVTMAARRAGKTGEIEYFFDCTAGDGHDSGWQDNAEYADKGLRPQTTYTYVAKARDKRTKKPIGEPSAPVAVTTRAATAGKGVESTHVEAIDKAITSGRLELIPLMITGDKDNRMNIVVVNRWEKGQRNAYDTAERRKEFIEDARHVLGAFGSNPEEAVPPYPTYRNFFNVYAVWWPDMPPWNPKDRKGGMHWADYNEIRARMFLPWRIEGRGWVTHLAMFNGSGGGGGAGLREDTRVGDAMIVGNKIEPFIHEFNHTAPGIPDEYTSSGMWGRGGEGATTTNDYRREHVKWRAWIEPDTPVPTPYSPKYLDKVGVFEGGVHRMAHLYRPTARGCIMGAGSFAGTSREMCAVCRQRAVQRFYRWVDAIDESTPARKEIALEGPATLRFSVKRVAPVPDTQKTEWRLNGKVIARGKDAVDVEFGPLAEYELVFALTDETPYVRHDPPHARSPQAEARWRITNTKPTATARPTPPVAPEPEDLPPPPAATPSKPGFVLSKPRFEKAGPRTIRIANPGEDLGYHWFAANIPPWLPSYPHGIYSGTFTTPRGRTCVAEAFVIQNKGGVYVDERKTRNDLGHWVHLMAQARGPKEDPMVVDVNTKPAPDGLVVTDETWKGNVSDGRLTLKGEEGVFDLVYISHPKQLDKPLHVGAEFAPPRSGNYYVGAQHTVSGEYSRNRIGVAVTVGPAVESPEPLAPDAVKDAKLLMWLDASDMDGDGKEDDPQPRRGSVIGWQGKADGVHCPSFVFYYPNTQNGKGVASWKTIWIQGNNKPVSGYQTIIMVRKEHDFSSVGTAPWQGLSSLIGVGEYGRTLMSDKVSEEMRKGSVHLNGVKVDPFKAPMPRDFYVVTYEFDRRVTQAFQRTDGHWEGALAECLVYDGKLTDAERQGVEEYLRRKWVSALDLERAPQLR